jgi:hypothetical protein
VIIRPVEGKTWRVGVGFAGLPPTGLLKQLVEAAGDHPPPHGVLGHKMFLYADDEANARAAYDDAERHVELRQVCIERWDAGQQQWLTIADTGPRARPVNNRSRFVPQFNWRPFAFLAALDVPLGALLYFVPGMPLSPSAGHAHQLGWTLGALVLLDVLVAVFMLFLYGD